MDIGTLQALGYLIMFGVGIFIVAALAGTIFDGVHRRVYDNKKKWDREL